MTRELVATLGLLGGTFDPIHYGHLELAREVRTALGLQAVRLIPAGDPPHRGPPGASAAHRLAMIELALGDYPDLEVDAREVTRPGPSYTVDTLADLHSEAPDRPLALIVGDDAFAGLPTWHRWHDLFDLAHFIVVARPGTTPDRALPPALASEWERRFTRDPRMLLRPQGGAIFAQPIAPHDISASAIRAELARDPDGAAAVRGLLPPAVLAYIDRNQLYRHPPDAT